MRILIIEDDEDARLNLCDILGLDDHQVQTAATAGDALAGAVDLSGVDVILLDRKLPDGLAEDILPSLRDHAPHAVPIIITGFADLQSTIAAFREGAVDYILKPIDPGLLRASLARVEERKRFQTQLENERQFAENIFGTAEAIVLVLDAQARVVKFNPYLTELTGLSLEEAQGKSWFDLLIPRDQRAQVEEIFERTVTQRDTRGVVNPILGRDGQQIEIRWSNATLKDRDGNPTGVLAVGLDISDLLRAQEQLLQTERLAAIGRTMAGLAHESRNALQRLQNAVELLEIQLEGRPEELQDLAKIERASNDLGRLLEEVRSYAAPIQLDRRLVDVATAWRNAWADLEPRRERHNAKLVEVVAGPTPRTRVDLCKLEQVFRNILENALDACADPVLIEVRCESAPQQRFRIRVTDNGPGLPPLQQAKIFEAFHSSKPTGTGLGLSIAKRIVEAHGGTLSVDGDAPSGACFLVELPLDQGEPSNASAHP